MFKFLNKERLKVKPGGSGGQNPKFNHHTMNGITPVVGPVNHH